jgi:hypothetical protein
MKTLVNRLSQINFRNVVAALAVSAAFFVSQSATAQISLPENAPVTEGVAEGFQAAIFPVYNSVDMKIHFLNPAQEKVSVMILNENKDVIYQKQVGKPAAFRGKFSLSQVPDGEYTMVIKSASHQISRDFSVQTQVARLAQAK